MQEKVWQLVFVGVCEVLLWFCLW